MTGIFVAYNQAYYDEIILLLENMAQEDIQVGQKSPDAEATRVNPILEHILGPHSMMRLLPLSKTTRSMT